MITYHLLVNGLREKLLLVSKKRDAAKMTGMAISLYSYFKFINMVELLFSHEFTYWEACRARQCFRRVHVPSYIKNLALQYNYSMYCSHTGPSTSIFFCKDKEYTLYVVVEFTPSGTHFCIFF